MDNGGDILQLCRLCLVKDQVNIPIFEEQGDIRQIFLKISSCLPVKVTPDDKLPKKICDGCSCKLDMLYEFWNTTANAEKQLVSWLDQAGLKANTETADQTMSVVAQQVSSKPSETVVKEEAADEIFMEEITFSEKWEEASSSAGPSATITSDEPPPKRARRAAAVRASLNVAAESDDEDDLDTELTKIEDESEDEDDAEVDDPSYVDAPSTSADDQPGPSGVGKDGGDAPKRFLHQIKMEYETTSDPKTGNTIYKCKKCSKSFQTMRHLRQHNYIHTLLKSFKCDTCNKKFKTNRELKNHLKVHESDREKFHCDVCDKYLSSKGCLKTHLKRHWKEYSIKCDYCDAGFYSNHEYALHVGAKHGQSDFVCDICNKSFYDKNYLQQHKLTHEEGYKLPKAKCEECKKWFLSDKLLKIHQKRYHSNTDPRHICYICGKKLSSNTSLKNHIIVHQGLKPFMCATCGRSFANKTTLRVHQRTHTGQKPYTCQICGKTFSQSSAHKIHLRKHRGENNYPCQICEDSFVTKTSLKIHVKNKHNIIMDASSSLMI
ncbi:gastrula zinc finger protein XlCGF26.1 isoform X17 [Aethina tumida]|uniref:gastrula zinc finger protein XlCGF26.1 isoform X17 n=1 Tax=Aethina tumida TaxID=116153 RepID=UPI0021474A00|nr:gastrula zinc finger protein XlCGF26.1 isoform X17 [Aethina tumida]